MCGGVVRDRCSVHAESIAAQHANECEIAYRDPACSIQPYRWAQGVGRRSCTARRPQLLDEGRNECGPPSTSSEPESRGKSRRCGVGRRRSAGPGHRARVADRPCRVRIAPCRAATDRRRSGNPWPLGAHRPALRASTASGPMSVVPCARVRVLMRLVPGWLRSEQVSVTRGRWRRAALRAS